MEKDRKFIAIRRDCFYLEEGRRYRHGLPNQTSHPPDAPMWNPPEDLEIQRNIPVEYFIFPVTTKGDWDGHDLLHNLVKKVYPEQLSGLQFTTMYLPQLHANPDTDNVSMIQSPVRSYEILKRHASDNIIEVHSLGEFFKQYRSHLPDEPPDIDVPEHVQALLSKVPEGPLNGIMVLAFDQQIAGSLASEELARSGALVIKVEKHEGGDPKRGNSSLNSFGTFNAGKFSVTFDNSAKGQQLRRDLLDLTDVVIDNRSKAAQERDHTLQDALRANQRIKPMIFCSICGFGRDDGSPAYDRVLQAESGMVDLNGQLIPFPLVDMATGKEAAAEITKSLFRRERMSLAQQARTPTIRLDISMVGVALSLMANQVTTFIDTGQARSTIVPFDIYPTQDGRISVAVATDDQFRRLAELIDAPEIAQYDTNDKRIANRNEVEKGLRTALDRRTSDEWVALLKEQGIPVGYVRDFGNALGTYGHDVLKSTAGNTLFVGSPTASNLYPSNPVIQDAPLHGEHTGDIGNLVNHLQSHQGVPRILQDSLRASGTGEEKYFQREYKFVDAHDVDFSGDESNKSWAKGRFFHVKKTGEITARKAEPYETIDVIHRDEIEIPHVSGIPALTERIVSEAVSKRIALEGDWVITTKSGDTYVRTDEQFRHSYVPVDGQPGTFKPNPALAPRKAVEITENVRFMSPSHDTSYIPAGGWLVEGSKGAYGIHPNNIEGNYEISKWVDREAGKVEETDRNKGNRLK